MGASASSKIVKRVGSNDPTLRVLDFVEVDLTGIPKEFNEAIAKNTHVESIWLNARNLKDQDIKDLCEALKQNDSVRQLGLSSNLIGDEGCKCLAGLLDEKSIHVLDLSCNTITDEGICVLAESIAKSASLKELLIGGNPVMEKGVLALMQAFRANKSLEVFVGFNIWNLLESVPEDMKDKIEDDIKNEAALHHLHQLHGFY